LATVLASAGADRHAIRDRLARIGNDVPAYEGVTGSIAFDAHGDVPAKSVVIGTVRAAGWSRRLRREHDSLADHRGTGGSAGRLDDRRTVVA